MRNPVATEEDSLAVADGAVSSHNEAFLACKTNFVKGKRELVAETIPKKQKPQLRR